MTDILLEAADLCYEVGNNPFPKAPRWLDNLGASNPPFLRTLSDLLRNAAQNHERRDDGPFSLVSWNYCSCGMQERFIAADGYPSFGPAKYPCKARVDAEALAGVILAK